VVDSKIFPNNLAW